MKKYESLKKVELHCHLDGSLNPFRVSKWTRKDISEVEKMLKISKSGSLTDYLKMFEYSLSLLQTKARLIDAAEQLCKDLIEDNVIYAEIRFDPMSHTKRGLALSEIVDAVLVGMKKTHLKANLILCMKRERSSEENKKIIDLAKKYSKKGVVAVDMAGDELVYPLKNHKEEFVYAKELEVPVVIHAGESGSYKEIDLAISYGARRIGHGIQAIKSFETMEKLKKHSIPLEVCVTSNMGLNLYQEYSDHPIARLIDSGVDVTINTDNRTIVDTTLTDEYNMLNRVFGFTTADFNKMNRTAIEYSFLKEAEKKELLKEFED